MTAPAVRAPRPMFRYTVHGLTLVSDLPLAGVTQLLSHPAGTDVTVAFAGTAAAESDIPSDGRIVEPSGGWLAWAEESARTRLRFGFDDHFVEFDIAEDGGAVCVRWTDDALAAHAKTLLLTTVMAYLLRCHDRVALHASVVARGDAAFAFAGTSGAGKSTTVAALLQRGCRGLGDDIAALACHSDAWRVHPGPATIRLAPDALAALGLPAPSALPIWPEAAALTGADATRFDDKRVVALTDQLVEPTRLAGVFLLGPRTAATPRLALASPADAVALLAPHLLNPAWLPRYIGASTFAALADMARRVPVYTVDRPDALEELPTLCALLGDEMDRAG